MDALWKPSPEAMRQTAMFRFMQACSSRYDFANDYDSLYRWSVESPAEFWAAVWEFTEIRASKKWDNVLVDGDAMPGAKWFVGSRLNFAENLLRYRDEQAAILFRDEVGNARELTYRELYDEVARVSEWLKEFGVVAGDRVAGYLPNTPEAIVAMLATASIGAVWSSCSPDFGVKGVLERFAQIRPKILFAGDGYHYNGKQFDVLESVATVVGELDSIRKRNHRAVIK